MPLPSMRLNLDLTDAEVTDSATLDSRLQSQNVCNICLQAKAFTFIHCSITSYTLQNVWAQLSCIIMLRERNTITYT
jgi:hypothetical protein